MASCCFQVTTEKGVSSQGHGCCLGDDNPFLSTTQKWTAEFKSGKESLEEGTSSGGSSTASTEENIDRVHYTVMGDRQLTIYGIVNAINISHDRFETSLHNGHGMTIFFCSEGATSYDTLSKTHRLSTSQKI